MKNIILIFTLLILFSCSKSGDEYIGFWYGDKKGEYLKIEKAGEGYLVEETFLSKNSSFQKVQSYCYFTDGCFIAKQDEKSKEFVCDNVQKLISIHSGNIYNQE